MEYLEDIRWDNICRWCKFGDEIQRSTTRIEGILITWDVRIPYNVFKGITDTFYVDLTLPITTMIPNGRMESLYHPEGYGCPVFSTLEDAVSFIKNRTL